MNKKLGGILKAMVSHFWIFVKRLYVFMLPFGVPYTISIGLVLLLSEWLDDLGICDISKIVCRILLTIVPAIPTSIYSRCEELEQHDEFSMDLCFVVWIATIVYAWKIL